MLSFKIEKYDRIEMLYKQYILLFHAIKDLEKGLNCEKGRPE
mgnify:CR=1 FL=1